MAAQLDIKYIRSEHDHGSGLACVSMLLAHFGHDTPTPTEHKLVQELEKIRNRDYSDILPEQRQLLLGDPNAYVELFESKPYRIPCRKREDGRVSRLEECLARGHPVIVFLGAKALRGRALRGVKTVDAGYQPVVVTRVSRWRVVFHDPDKNYGRAYRSMRRGRHMFSQPRTFESKWSVWQQWLYVLGYLTLRMPDIAPAARLQPWVFVETWRPTGTYGELDS